MDIQNATLVMIPKEEWVGLVTTQQDILLQLRELNTKGATSIPLKHITAQEFMTAVRIRRTKFNELMAANKIRTIKKRRKIYVPISEVERYFNDPTIQ